VNAEKWERVAEIFQAVRRVGPEERAAMLDEQCGDDAELRTEVESLIESSGGTGEFLEGPAVGFDPAVVSDGDASCGKTSSNAEPAAYRSISGYRIVRVIGEGGMGVVYEAEQEQPKRTVALKVMRPGYMSRGALRRFQHEADILGRLHHTGIAQIYEASVCQGLETGDDIGERDEGSSTPFFAMELVRGMPLTVYCNEHGLGNEERLELVIKVCDAVHHAHLNGVIHRDLKPANILVDETGQPKILDFGIAKVTDCDIQITTMHTDMGQLLGTIGYMSPEQCSGDPGNLDMRSDVYTLGVICFELLADRLPISVHGKMIHEAVSIIRDEDPVRLGTINHAFRGDLETILSRVLEKDKTRRYQSAFDLAAEIERYLRDEPITARPPSVMYQFRKFAKRNKALVCGAGAVMTILVVAVVLLSLLWARTTREARRAEDASAFLKQMFSDVAPHAHGSNIKLKDVLDRATDRLAVEPPQDRLVEAIVRNEIGSSYYSLGLYQNADPHYAESLAIRRDELGGDHVDTLKVINNLGQLRLAQGRTDEALSLLGECLEKRRKILGPDDKETLATQNNLAYLYQSRRRYKEAENLFRDTVDRQRRVFGPDNLDTLISMSNLAGVLHAQQRLSEAEDLFRRTLALCRSALGNENYHTLVTMDSLAVVLKARNKFDEAEPLMREAVQTYQRSLGHSHPGTLVAMNNLARLLQSSNRLNEAAVLFIELTELADENLPPDDRFLPSFHFNCAECLTALGRTEDALLHYRTAYKGFAARLGRDASRTRSVAERLIKLYEAQGRRREAQELRELHFPPSSARKPGG